MPQRAPVSARGDNRTITVPETGFRLSIQAPFVVSNEHPAGASDRAGPSAKDRYGKGWMVNGMKLLPA